MKKSSRRSDKKLLSSIHKVYDEREGKRRTPLKESAVLVPIMQKEELRLLYEVRSWDLSAQPGDVCFPGGRIEEGETREEAAIRETCEELLIPPDRITIIGAMDSFELGNGAIVWPFVGLIEGDVTYSRDEVDHLFSVPLNYFFNHQPEKYTLTLKTVPEARFPLTRLPQGKDYQWGKKVRQVYMYTYHNEVIWGLTANITYAFIKSLEKIAI